MARGSILDGGNFRTIARNRFALGLASRRPWRWERSQGFQHEGSREDEGGHGAECKLRFARSALNPTPWPSMSSPASSVLIFFLDRGRHMFPPLSGEKADSSDCPGGNSAWRSTTRVWHLQTDAFRSGDGSCQDRTRSTTRAGTSQSTGVGYQSCFRRVSQPEQAGSHPKSHTASTTFHHPW